MNPILTAERGQRKTKAAMTALWMTFALSLVILAVAWAVNDGQGETVRSAIEKTTGMWPWAMLGILGTFGGANALAHFAKKDGDA